MANSKKRCKHCKTYAVASDGLQLSVGFFHNFDCATKFAQNKLQEKRANDRAQSAQLKKMKPIDLKRKDLDWQHKKTQPVFNRLRVAEELKWFDDRGLEPTCISCQKPLGLDIWCCGHLKTVGSNGRLRYDKLNTYLQCNRYCNMGLSGNIEGYKKGLLLRFGIEGDAIIQYCESSNSPLKRTCEELEAMRKDFSKQLRNITKP